MIVESGPRTEGQLDGEAYGGSQPPGSRDESKTSNLRHTPFPYLAI